MGYEEIKIGIIGDVIFEDSELIEFIGKCLAGTGGYSQIRDGLKSKGYINFSDYAYKILSQSRRSGLLEILEFSVEEVYEFCKSIINTLIMMGDLGTLTAMTKDHAQDCLRRLYCLSVK